MEYYIYVLRSLKVPSKTYVGFTQDLERRLAEHNEGSPIYSRRYAPWARVAHVAFNDKTAALAFEKYLKTPSGKAFLLKHFLPQSMGIEAKSEARA